MPDPLYVAPAIVRGDQTFWLPPWMSVKTVRSLMVERVSVPHADSAVIAAVRDNQGARITITARYKPGTSSQAIVLAAMETLWANLADGPFRFHYWSDRGWPNCAAISMEDDIPLGDTLTYLAAQIEIVSATSRPDTSLSLAFSNYDSQYPYAAEVGRPSGDAPDPGGSIPVNQRSMQTPTLVLAGMQNSGQVTSEGAEWQYRVGGTTGSLWRLKGVKVTAAQTPGLGDLVVRFGNDSIANGGGDYVDLTLPEGEIVSAEQSADILFFAGQTLYGYIVDAPEIIGPGGVQIALRLEASFS